MFWEALPQLVATLAIAKIAMGGIFVALYLNHRNRSLAWFGVAFVADGARHFTEFIPPGAIQNLSEGTLLTLATLGLLRGAIEPTGRRGTSPWDAVIAILFVGSVVGPLMGWPLEVLVPIVGVCLALARGRAALSILAWAPRGALAWVAAGSLLVMAGYAATFPLFIHRPEVLNWGYYGMTLLVFMLGTSLLLLLLEDAQRRALDHEAEVATERATSDALREELERARRLEVLGLVAGGLAHDFNNVLTTVQSSVELALSDDEGPTKALLEEIAEAAQRGTQLTQRMLTVARRQPDLKQQVELVNFLRNEEEFLSAAAGSGRRVKVLLPRDLFVLTTLDAVKLQQVLINLVVNARDAGAETVLVHLHAKPPSSAVVLEVEDDGPGIPQELEDRVFDPLFTTKGTAGTGLGLASVRTIVDDHDWHIELDRGPRGGARFRITMEASSVTTAAFALSSGTIDVDSPRPDFEHVLVLDDDEALARMISRLLSRKGYRVSCCSRAGDALEAVDREDVDIVLTDLHMPDQDGLAFIAEAQRRRPDLKFLLTSGHGVDSKELPPNTGYLAKPFRASQLVDELQRVWGSRPVGGRANVPTPVALRAELPVP